MTRARLGKKGISPQLTMQEVLEAYPAARRALFQRYHIGACSSGGFHPEETLEQISQRNNNLNKGIIRSHT